MVVVVDLEQLARAGFCGIVSVSLTDCLLLSSVAISVCELPTGQLGSVLIVISNVPSSLTAIIVPGEGAIVAWYAPSKNDVPVWVAGDA